MSMSINDDISYGYEFLVEDNKPLLKYNSNALKLHIALLYILALIGFIACGTAYGFAAYSQDLKDKLKLSEVEVHVIGALSNVGSNFGPLSGLLISILSIRYCLLIGSLLGFIGYFLDSRAVSLDPHFSFFQHYLAYGICYFLAGFASNLCYSTLLQVTIHNVNPKYRAISVSGL